MIKMMGMASYNEKQQCIRFKNKNYLIEKQLGEGGFAFVYQVQDPDSGQIFALKKINIQGKSDLMNLVKNEVQIWKQISNHRNIVSIHGVEQQNDLVLILCDACLGGTLFDLLMKYNGKLSETQILHILKDICNGLKHMHDMGIQHRDIKVENILLDNKSKAFRLCDFGSSSSQILDYNQNVTNNIDDVMEQFEKYTTMMYRPPEMIDKYLKYRVDTQVDIWMLGCVAFSLCFGFHPFQDSQKIAILNAQYFIPNEKDNRISEKLKDLISAILVPNPDERPNINQILQILNNWEIVPKIKLSESAIRIREKNQGNFQIQQTQQVQNKEKKKFGDIDANELAKLQEKIRMEQEKKNIKKQHIPLNQNQSLNIQNQVQINKQQKNKNDLFQFQQKQENQNFFDFDFNQNQNNQNQNQNQIFQFEMQNKNQNSQNLLDFDAFDKQENSNQDFFSQMSDIQFNQNAPVKNNNDQTQDFFKF